MYVIVKALIDKGRTEGLAEKVSKLYLFGQITDGEYSELMTLLGVAV